MLIEFLSWGQWPESVFWNLTPKRFYLYREAFHARKEVDFETDMNIAYIGACLVMASERPSLEQILGKEDDFMVEQSELTDIELGDQLIQALEQFNRTI